MAVKSELVSRVSKVTRNAEHCHQATMHDSCKFLSWICSTLTETRLRSVAPTGSFRSLSGLTSLSYSPALNGSATPPLEICFTLTEFRTWSLAPECSICSLPGLTSFRPSTNFPSRRRFALCRLALRPSANPLITQSLSHLITSKRAVFTIAEVLITLAVIMAWPFVWVIENERGLSYFLLLLDAEFSCFWKELE